MPVIDQQAETARDLLREHVVGALRDVRAAREALGHAPAVADMADRSLFDFDDALEQHHAGLVAVLESVGAGDPLDDCWAEFRPIAERLRQALGECFAYVHGAVARSAGFGTRLCALADGLLDDLAERTPAGGAG